MTAYTSKGERKNISSKLLSGMKRDRDSSVKMLNIQSAYLKGQNPWITMENPNKEQTNKKFIRVRANDIYGSPKERAKKSFMIAGGKD